MWSGTAGQGTEVDERCRFERQARRPFCQRKYARPSQLTGHRIGLRTRAAEDALCALPLSYAPRRAAGLEPATAQSHEGTPTYAAGRFDCQGARQPQRHRVAARPGLEPGAPASEAGVVPVPPPRIDHFVVWTERLELPTPGFRRRCAPIAPRPGGTDGGSRTRTAGVLSAVPLPVGLRQQEWCSVDRAGFEPATFSLQGSCASGLRHRPWWRGRGSNPRAGRMRPR